MSAVRLVLGLPLIVLPLLLLTAGAVAAPSPSAAPPVPTAHAGQSGPPRLVDVQHLTAATAGSHPKRYPVFRPRDPAAFARAKRAVQQGTSAGTPAKAIKVMTLARLATKGSLGTRQTAQAQASFPLMSDAQQINAFGSDQAVAPPDTQLAAGPTDLLEMVNDSGSVWTKTGSLVRDFDLNRFFPVPSGYTFSDPRVLYDAPTGRWFASGLSFDASSDSQVYVMVSSSSDPTGSWYSYVVASNTSGVIDDQPKIGVNDDKVVISWNDFASSGSFAGAETWVLQKSQMLDGQPFTYTSFGPDLNRFDLVPSQSLTATGIEYLVYNNSDPLLSENGQYPSVGVVAISGTPALHTVSWSESDPQIAPTSLPPSAMQPGGAPLIQTDDDRLLAATWQNGVLWTAGNDACVPNGDTATHACLRVIQMSTAGGSPTILQDVDVGVVGDDLFYPAVAPDSQGNAIVVFSVSSPTLDPSVAATTLPASGPSSTGSFTLLYDGAGIYDDGIGNRWGDYSAAAPDPVAPAQIWVAGEYAASGQNSTDWGTAAALVDDSASPPPPTATPSPTSTATATWTISMTANIVVAPVGAAVTLTAQTNQDVGPTPYFIYVIDQSTGATLAACGYGTACQTQASFNVPTTQSFVAEVGMPVQTISSVVTVAWNGPPPTPTPFSIYLPEVVSGG